MAIIIEAKNLMKNYSEDETETPALQGVSLTIKEGEFVAIMGPSGSGKSTLLHILGFLDRPTGGEYIFAEKNMNNYSDDELAAIRNKKMGFVFQAFNLLPRTTVHDNVKLPLMYSHAAESHWESMTKKAITSVGLEHRINHESSQLSGGEKQRVAIARALVNDPSVIFADEPTGNLDSKSGGQVMEILQKLHDEGKTIVLITHETYTAEYAQRIIRLKDGLLDTDLQVATRRRANNRFIK
ncbi:ABC transporter ATP-binding protein [Candidatus Peregrinibacteria bacterium]|nr:ABC transporter ATP-binding protein [Candidatus Peregrinibacteria bacterium]